MHSKHSRLVTAFAVGSGVIGFGLAGGSLPASAAPAPAPKASLTASASGGMVYAGSSASNTVRITLSVGMFTVDDSGPITIGAGCTTVAGDPTMGRCVAPGRPTVPSNDSASPADPATMWSST